MAECCASHRVLVTFMTKKRQEELPFIKCLVGERVCCQCAVCWKYSILLAPIWNEASFHFGKLEFICSYIANNFLYGVVSCFSHLINWRIVLKYLSFFDRAWQYLLIYFNTHRAKYLNVVTSHLSSTVLWKHTENTRKTLIFLKQPTKDWDLEVQRFVKPWLKLDFV